MPTTTLPSRDALLHQPDVLVVFRDPQPTPKPAPGQPGTHSDFVPTEPELFIAVLADGRVLGFNGHVDLGTGIRTALGQIVAEELDVPFEAVTMVLGHPSEVPNQGPTIASASIQITAQPLRIAAAQARERLRALAAGHLSVPAERLVSEDGALHDRENPDRRVAYGALVAGRREDLKLAAEAPLKPRADYRLVGRPAARVDIPAKARGELTFVHDVRVPGMLHGRVVRPPYHGLDRGDFVGTSLIEVDRDSVAGLPGLVDVVVQGDFVGVVAEREEQAMRAARCLKVRWREPDGLPALDGPEDLEAALRALPAQRRALLDDEDGEPPAGPTLRRTYVWPYQLHGSIGPSCSVAEYADHRLTVWSGTQNPHSLRADLSRLLDLDEGRIDIQRLEASGCYGRNCADDVGADAALLSRAVGRPVRVQLSREEEHLWEPKGAAQVMDVEGERDADGAPASYRFVTRYPSDNAPTLALRLTGKVAASEHPFQMGDRTAVPPYAYPRRHIASDDVPTLIRAAWLRGVSALPNTFAHDSYIDELAALAGDDPLAYRLRYLDDERARAVLGAAAERAGWAPRERRAPTPDADGWLHGRGLAYARYVHSKFPGFGAALAAWVVFLKVHPGSGAIRVERLVVAQDAGLMVNPAGVRHQVHGNIIQMLGRTLKESVPFENGRPAAREWGGYPLLRFSELPEIDLVLLEPPDTPPLGVGESTALPAAPAIANALFDATGVRFRRPPFTPDRVRATLADDAWEAV
ncbi:xanthine dehydrogenase family protein molybdopterin-binding subunit [Alloalcanivorax profundimaris]|uniref:xanthine dehydrogenase family protein molybdopterin-binding subunit n=1 Tax=Alloalcanivorax profundimaris TaxID=2735259 RepID=UPI001888234F|nr:molybdopterin cofactor-binding domain-containing protein [Alloalcanivorax profundimaris]MBF1801323.1 xanthine dehydrogenase family protein molybdopterin-binding subunit [Alloalcanivorax profundimaris]